MKKTERWKRERYEEDKEMKIHDKGREMKRERERWSMKKGKIDEEKRWKGGRDLPNVKVRSLLHSLTRYKMNINITEFIGSN